MLGPSLLVQPITAMGLATTNVYLPAAEEAATALWFDLHTAEQHVSAPGARVLEANPTLTIAPILTLALSLSLSLSLSLTLTRRARARGVRGAAGPRACLRARWDRAAQASK
jgi:hypothetical protein